VPLCRLSAVLLAPVLDVRLQAVTASLNALASSGHAALKEISLSMWLARSSYSPRVPSAETAAPSARGRGKGTDKKKSDAPSWTAADDDAFAERLRRLRLFARLPRLRRLVSQPTSCDFVRSSPRGAASKSASAKASASGGSGTAARAGFERKAERKHGASSGSATAAKAGDRARAAGAEFTVVRDRPGKARKLTNEQLDSVDKQMAAAP
jgi:hypothetical protein